MSVTFTIEGLPEIARALRKLGDDDTKEALRSANKNLAAKVAAAALPNVPVGATGRLKGSVRTLASERGAVALAGSDTVRYGSVVHWGAASRNIQGRPFLRDAATRVAVNAATDYLAAIDRMISRAGLK